jgi:ABC-type sugar transport system substrate-binding protein
LITSGEKKGLPKIGGIDMEKEVLSYVTDGQFNEEVLQPDLPENVRGEAKGSNRL